MICTSMALSAVLLGTSQVSSGSGFEDILAASPEQPSEVYKVLVNGQPVRVQRNDGREGPLSYVHLVLSGTARFTVDRPAPVGDWTVFPAEAAMNRTGSPDSLSFDLAPGTNLIIESSERERLYILADAEPESSPRLGDPGVVSLVDYGVEPSGEELQTPRIQAAIDEAASGSNGRILYFPPGVYRTGTLRMRSGITLHLAPGALLQGSVDPEDYPLDPGTRETPDRTQDIRTRLLLFDEAQDSGICGLGEIDGMGHILRAKHHRVPNIIRVRRSRNIRIEGVTLRRAAGWNTHIFHSNHVTVRNIKILGTWSDGIDVDNSRNVTIENVLSSSYDDSFVVKATWFDETAERVGDIVLRDCLLWTTKAATKIGTETRAKRMEDITLEDVTIAGGREAITIKCCDGAVVRNVLYKNVRCHVADFSELAILFEMHSRNGKGRIEDIRIESLHVDGELPSAMSGLDEEHAIRDVKFADFCLGKQKILGPEAAKLRTNEWVKDVVFR